MENRLTGSMVGCSFWVEILGPVLFVH